jgi:hypothetical protein
MKIQVHYNGDMRGEIPYSSLPAFRLLCEQNGLQVRWNAEERSLHLNSGLSGIKIFLASGLHESGTSLKRESGYEHEVMKKIKEFLSDSGADITLLYDHSLTPSYGDMCTRLTFLQDDLVKIPEITLYYDWYMNTKKVLDYFEEQFQNAEVTFTAKRRSRTSLNMPLFDLQCHLPSSNEASSSFFLIEDIAVSLSSGILLYFQETGQTSPFACLPLCGLKEFIHETSVNQEPSASMIQSKEYEKMVTLLEKRIDEDSNVSESEVEHIEVKGLSLPAEEAQMQAEVFFDYIVLPSEREESPYLVMGNLYIKNTGQENLYNPVICLKATPADGVKLQGQIIPANMVETLGMQSSEGAKGWRYLQKDWFAEAMERGEYWIAPVQHFEIAPEEMQALDNFQLSILKPEEPGTVTIEAFVYFKEREVPFASNNHIVFSF